MKKKEVMQILRDGGCIVKAETPSPSKPHIRYVSKRIFKKDEPLRHFGGRHLHGLTWRAVMRENMEMVKQYKLPTDGDVPTEITYWVYKLKETN